MLTQVDTIGTEKEHRGYILPYDPLNPDANAISRGVLRLLDGLAFAGLTEVTLPNRRRADVMAIGGGGEITIVEIKSSVADFRSDGKWEDYLPYCDQFLFAVPGHFPQDLIPNHTGLIVADAFGGAILRQSPVNKLAAARRKALTLRFARLAATRLTIGGAESGKNDSDLNDILL